MSDPTAQKVAHGFRGYNPDRYPRPSVTVDLVLFTVRDGGLSVLLIRRGAPPFEGALALPGGFVRVGEGALDQGEGLDEAARRELGEETGLTGELLDASRVHLEQLHTFGAPGRDPRLRVISVAYLALVPPDLIAETKAGDDAAEALWVRVDEVDTTSLAFDHARILEVALARLRDRVDASSVAASLVPQSFTTTELRVVFEAVLGRPYDAANFRRRLRRLVEDGVLIETGATRASGRRGGRPAALYAFCC